MCAPTLSLFVMARLDRILRCPKKIPLTDDRQNVWLIIAARPLHFLGRAAYNDLLRTFTALSKVYRF
ncbi:MAG: hypothetical protein A3I66_24080 [Burkholderiales bacterium RIFCSPLOWO2_02_FULL_57_36]|nr:MAG: hypothetical protein A3I66_24080 [Burkholderiales bacterium RIFCSPLOWO2_02_FULL_57_36]